MPSTYRHVHGIGVEGGAQQEDLVVTTYRDPRIGRRHLAAGIVLVSGCIAALALLPRLFEQDSRASRANPSAVVSEQMIELGPMANTCQKLHPGVDFVYSELAGVGHLDNVVSSQDCCTLCQGEPTCKAFTWVQDAKLLSGNPGQCWLKGGQYLNSNPKDGVFSAFVRDPRSQAIVKADEEAKAKQAEENAKWVAKIEGNADAPKALGKNKKAAKRVSEAFQIVQEAAKREAEAAKVERNAKAKVLEVAEATKTAIVPPSTPPALWTTTATETKTTATETPTVTKTATSTLTLTATQTPTSTSTVTLTSTDTTTTASSTSTITHTRTLTTSSTPVEQPCCAFEPFVGCGSALNISYFCDTNKTQCEKHCFGKWLPHGKAQNTQGLDLRQPTLPPKPSPPPPRKNKGPCCSFEPLKACGDELAISSYCDVSKDQCENRCAGKWLHRGPDENPDGLDLYA